MVFLRRLTQVSLFDGHKRGDGMLLEDERPFNILLNDLGAHIFLVLPSEKLAKSPETKNTDSPSRETWFADPNVFCSIDACILGVTFLELFVHFVGLVHDVQIGNFPPSEAEHIRVDT